MANNSETRQRHDPDRLPGYYERDPRKRYASQAVEKYSREYEYAKDISFDDTCNTIQTIMDAIMV